jgi:hypothetical protein
MRTTRTTGLMLATGLATLALLQPAMALDAEAFVDRIEAVYEVMGYDLSFGAATLDGDTVTVDGVTVAIVGLPEESYAFDTELTFTGVVEHEDGSYTATRLTVPDVDTQFATDPAGHLTLTGMVAEDLYLPPAGETGAEHLLQTVGRVATGPLSITRDGVEVVAFESTEITSEFTHNDDDTLAGIVSNLAISGIWADLSTVKDEEPEAGAIIEALGLTEIDGDITQVLNWTMGDGHLVVEEFLFDFTDVGALNITADISGFTPAVLDKIYAMQASELDPASEEAQAQQMMLGMELLQALSITSAVIRYDDASLAPKLLDLFAAQSGTDRASFVEGLKTTVPAMVGEAGIPALTDIVVPAVNAFLDDPQSFEIAVRPPNPTSLLVLSAAAANPAGLISAIGLSVTANQPAQ